MFKSKQRSRSSTPPPLEMSLHSEGFMDRLHTFDNDDDDNDDDIVDDDNDDNVDYEK